MSTNRDSRPSLRRHVLDALFGLILWQLALPAGAADIASGDTLRAVYLSTNPAQAISAEVRGASATLARELAARHKLALDFKALSGPPDVIGAVRSGAADIGFVAYEATRLGTVAFSHTYMLVQQSFLVPERSPIRTAGEVDAAGVKVGGTRNDSITLCMKRIFKRASSLQATPRSPTRSRPAPLTRLRQTATD